MARFDQVREALLINIPNSAAKSKISAMNNPSAAIRHAARSNPGGWLCGERAGTFGPAPWRLWIGSESSGDRLGAERRGYAATALGRACSGGSSARRKRSPVPKHLPTSARIRGRTQPRRHQGRAARKVQSRRRRTVGSSNATPRAAGSTATRPPPSPGDGRPRLFGDPSFFHTSWVISFHAGRRNCRLALHRCHQAVVDKHVHRVASQLVEFHGQSPFGQPKHILHQHSCPPEFDFDIKFDVAK